MAEYMGGANKSDYTLFPENQGDPDYSQNPYTLGAEPSTYQPYSGGDILTAAGPSMVQGGASGFAAGGPWGAAAGIGAGLLQGIFQLKLAQEAENKAKAAKWEQREWDLKKASINAPVNKADDVSNSIARLMSAWGGTRR